MRQWFDSCAFADAPNSAYWQAAKAFPTADEAKTTSEYIGNLLANARTELRLGQNSQVQSNMHALATGGGLAAAVEDGTFAEPPAE